MDGNVPVLLGSAIAGAITPIASADVKKIFWVMISSLPCFVKLNKNCLYNNKGTWRLRTIIFRKYRAYSIVVDIIRNTPTIMKLEVFHVPTDTETEEFLRPVVIRILFLIYKY